MIFSFYHVYFVAFFAIFSEFIWHTDSVQQRNHWFTTKVVFFQPYLRPTNNSFVAQLTQCNKKFQLYGKKKHKNEEKVKNVNHQTKIIILGYLDSLPVASNLYLKLSPNKFKKFVRLILDHCCMTLLQQRRGAICSILASTCGRTIQIFHAGKYKFYHLKFSILVL